MKPLNLLIAFLLVFQFIAKAQYPFEKFKALKYDEFNNWNTILYDVDSLPTKREITINEFDNKNNYLKITQEIKFSIPDSIEYSELSISLNGNQINRFKVDTRFFPEPLPVFIADINGDHLKDLKIIFPSYGCGAFNYYCETVFLFQNEKGSFNKIVYTDIFEEFVNKPERDFNNDGNYEIITQTFKNFSKHNYWLFNIYNYRKGKFVNVNILANYPIMIPLNSHNISKKISRKKMKEFEISSPTD